LLKSHVALLLHQVGDVDDVYGFNFADDNFLPFPWFAAAAPMRARLLASYLPRGKVSSARFLAPMCVAIFWLDSMRAPVYVSVGNMVILQEVIEIVQHATRGNRVPESILHAHKLANEKRKAQLPPHH
jgi:hypothetical protein